MGNWNSWYCLAKIKVKAVLVWYFVPLISVTSSYQKAIFRQALMQRSIEIIFTKL